MDVSRLSVLKSGMDDNSFRKEIRSLTYRHFKVQDRMKYNPSASAFLLESVESGKEFFHHDRFWIRLERFA